MAKIVRWKQAPDDDAIMLDVYTRKLRDVLIAMGIHETATSNTYWTFKFENEGILNRVLNMLRKMKEEGTDFDEY